MCTYIICWKTQIQSYNVHYTNNAYHYDNHHNNTVTSNQELTENDEFVYQEMITHLPMMAHPNPKNVLIVGGGDGGVLREVCRHPCVDKITLVEIDEMVIEVAKEFFGESTATSFDDSRLTLIHEDAAEFLKRHNESNCGDKYDVSF